MTKCKNCTVEDLLRENLRKKAEEYKRVGRELNAGIKLSKTLFALSRAGQEMEIAERMFMAFERGDFKCPLKEE